MDTALANRQHRVIAVSALVLVTATIAAALAWGWWQRCSAINFPMAPSLDISTLLGDATPVTVTFSAAGRA